MEFCFHTSPGHKGSGWPLTCKWTCDDKGSAAFGEITCWNEAEPLALLHRLPPKCIKEVNTNQKRRYVSVQVEQLFISGFVAAFHTFVWLCQTEPHRKKLVVLEYWCKLFCLIINFMWLLSTGEVVSFRIYIFKMKCILEINYDWTVILCLVSFRFESIFESVVRNVNRMQQFEYFSVIKLDPGLKLWITSWNYGSTVKPQETKYPTVNTDVETTKINTESIFDTLHFH